MAMNKKEIQEMEDLKIKLSLRFTEKVEKDIPIPPSGIVNGYSINAHKRSVDKSCSSLISHSCGSWSRTTSQQGISQYSTELLAYKALRAELEKEYAKNLREIDKKIEQLLVL